MKLLNNIFLLNLAYIFIPNFLYATEAKGGMPQLDPSSYSSQTFWLIIVFVLLFVSINSYFFPKITTIRNRREETIKNSLDIAKKSNEEALLLKEKLDSSLLEANYQAEKIINNSVEKSRHEFEKRINKLNEELDKKSLIVIEKLETEKKKILNNINDYAFEISNLIYNDLLDEKKSISLDDFKKLNNN